MKIQKIEIKNLFDQFDYDIPLTNPEDLLILTAPNGFGKTMILNIIDSLFNKKFWFFHKLVFDNIKIYLTEQTTIEISKDVEKIAFYLKKKSSELSYSYSIAEFAEIIKLISLQVPHMKFDDNIGLWRGAIDENPSGQYTMKTSEVIRHFKDNLSQKVLEKYDKQNDNHFPTELIQVLNKLATHLIKEQRLLSNSNKFTIITLANELRNNIQKKELETSVLTRELDSTFPKRLLTEKKQLTEIEFTNRFEVLRQKQAKLHKFGLSESEQEVPPYSEENARLLSVYLNDIEKKVGVFDNLIQKLDLFTTILNERRFTFKTIQINKEKGFHFVTNKGKELSLTDLSSGEQHEVVLLYELIFRTTSNTLVLIDEPEISLHITWQKEFLKDLLAIIELQKMQVIVATHSPSIINDRWDLVFNLQTQEMQ